MDLNKDGINDIKVNRNRCDGSCAITDPEAEKALLAHLKTIEPERIIK